MATASTPGCLTCRKRQVRCDGNRPTCRRCPSDGRECRGYKGQLRIVQVDPAKISASNACKRSKAAPQFLSVADLSLPRHIFASDRDVWTIMDCTEYWNRHVIPEIFPVERPFYRVTIQPNDIAAQTVPKVCLHFIIVAFRSAQAAKLLIDPSTQPDLCYYRGLGLRELQQYLEGAATDPEGIALVSIVTLMTSELYIPKSSWLIHFNAAQRIVALRGGMASCMRSVVNTNFILVQFFVIDTLTSTTCDSSVLPQAPYQERIGDMPDIDFQLISCASACPAEILKSIAYTSALRRRNLEDTRTPSAEFDAVLRNLEEFDCTAWAVKMSNMGLSHPIVAAKVAPCSSIEGLVSVAESFRSAALIYLFLGCGISVNEHDRMERARTATAILHDELNNLFDKASDDPDRPIDTQLWKFATWPLFIAAYVGVGWDIAAPTGDLDRLYARLHRIGKARGALLRSNAEGHLKDVQARRAKCLDRTWTWDMGFTDRRACVL